MHSGLGDLGHSDHFPRPLTCRPRKEDGESGVVKARLVLEIKRQTMRRSVGKLGREGVLRLDIVDQLC